MIKRVLNQSKSLMEPAEMKRCPRCSGFGSVLRDNGPCPICNGYGTAWVTASGWTLPKYQQNPEASRLY